MKFLKFISVLLLTGFIFMILLLQPCLNAFAFLIDYPKFFNYNWTHNLIIVIPFFVVNLLTVMYFMFEIMPKLFKQIEK